MPSARYRVLSEKDYKHAAIDHAVKYAEGQVAFRFNNREEKDLGRFVGVLRSILGKRLTYAELISADMVPATT